MPLGSKLVVAAATFNRPEGLSLLLEGLERLEFRGPEPRIEIAIVDNSPDANARTLVETRARSFRWPLLYVHEDRRGIAQARNRALDVAQARRADWIAFIDDDEVPDPCWLHRMMTVAGETGATAVVGAVRARFQIEPKPWMVNGGFFSIERYAENAELDFGNTSNVVFDLAFTRRHGIRFDPAFALTGGEDTLFFEHVRARGGRIVFCRSGVVHEAIVPHRARLGWLLKRWCRTGNTDGRIILLAHPTLKHRLVHVLAGGLARLAVGGGLALLASPAALLGRAHVPAEHLRVASRGLGFLLSAFGSTLHEYRTTTR